MDSSSPIVNGDLSHTTQSQIAGAPHVEETLQQMNILIKENRELKEALKQTNMSMKERFEGLSAWKEKQKEERGFLEKRLEEAKQRVQALDSENELLKKRVQEMEKQHTDAEEAKALMSQIARLQAEKNDLVAINSELQLKMSQASPEDSFIEIRIAEGEMNVTRDLPPQKDLSASCTTKLDMTGSRLESEEQTVSQLLQSLRAETQQKEQLQLQLQAAQKRIAELEMKEPNRESETQTSLPCVTAAQETQSRISQEESAKSASEVENLKTQLMSLFNELQQAQSKLDEAENMKKNLQDRCKELEQDLSTLKTQLGEREQLQAEHDRVKVQLESMQAANKLEQKKVQEERTALAQLKDAYTKLFEDYEELQQENKKRQGNVSQEEYRDLQTRIAAAEQALADKQQKIDLMKQELCEKDKELDTVSVFKAQAEVYSSDFYAERAAREKIHEEKERLAAQLEFIKKQNIQLQDEVESMGRQSMSEMQRRHMSRVGNPALKLLKSQSINVNWYVYCPETAVLVLSTTVQGNVLQPFAFKNGTISKMPKFEIELPVAPKPAKIILSERDIAVATIYGQLYVMYLKHHTRTTNSPGAEVVLYHLPREGSCKKAHVLKLNTSGKFALNVVDNLVVVHHQSSRTSLIYDIKLKEPDCALNIHQPVLPAQSIHPYKISVTGPVAASSQPCELYSSTWSVFQPDIIISASEGYLWYLHVKLHPTVNLLQDKGKLMDFLLHRSECKMVILTVCSQMLVGGEKGNLPVVATVFDKLNQVYKEYLDADQAYTLAMESGPSRFSNSCKRPVRTQAVIDQSDMYMHVFSAFTDNKDVSHKFVIAVLMEYIRSLNQFQITVQHYFYELVIKTLVQHNLFYMLHQFLQYHVLSDSKPLACLLLSLESTYPPAHQLSLDMLKRLSTANDEIVEVLLSKQQVLGALRFVRSVGGHDNVSARKFLDAARQTKDTMLFFTIFRFFEQRNYRLRGNPAFNPGEHCEEHVTYFKEVFGEQTLMKLPVV